MAEQVQIGPRVSDAAPHDLEVEDPEQSFIHRHRVSFLVLFGMMMVTSFFAGRSVVGMLIALPSLALSAVLFDGWIRGRSARGLFIATGVVAVVTLLAASYLQDNPFGAIASGTVAGIWIASQPHFRKRLMIFATGAIGGLSCVALLSDRPYAMQMILTSVVIAAVWLWSIGDVGEQTRLIRALTRAKDAEQEASLLRQRNRIAADLHDIQGHTLHVIKLKAAVAARVRESDPARAAEELEAIQSLIAESIDQGRQLVNATQRLSLANEAGSAVGLFEASGIAATVTGADAAHADWEADAALVLREATTNILRHAHAERVEVRVRPRSIEIRNDGVPDTLRPQRGLARLAERIADRGGTLEASVADGWFIVRAVGAAGDESPDPFADASTSHESTRKATL
ncbi:hypothetical protein GCM10009847_02840 [Leucobacter tardus]|uniref:Signal transduction histidine kinase subgroup 3 dimerisation and phosphoacceptor domain-containing protein n=1 Tax=Leucobacter tardus TaxID=501483 RepID=A0A939QE34_9MICO|nr:histidine kinase [Leucobacter tardus]MBO2988493.1 hypothetical protein [Leucobacter tardus]